MDENKTKSKMVDQQRAEFHRNSQPGAEPDFNQESVQIEESFVSQLIEDFDFVDADDFEHESGETIDSAKLTGLKVKNFRQESRTGLAVKRQGSKPFLRTISKRRVIKRSPVLEKKNICTKTSPSSSSITTR